MSKDVISAILAQAEAKKPKNTKKTGFSLDNYFGIYLKDTEQTKQYRIRILPSNNDENKSPFEVVYGHKIQQFDGKWKTFLCPKEHKDEECAFCELESKLRASDNPEDKKLARKYSTREMYVARIIVRGENGEEDSNVKFWRFGKSYNGNGILDKIIAIIKMKQVDITDRDLFITINKDQNGNPVVNSILDGDKQDLSEDPAKAERWLSDEKTWRDVYAIKNYDYLKIILMGKEPYYSKDKGMYVSKEEYDLIKENKENSLNSSGEISMGKLEEQLPKPPTPTVTKTDTPTKGIEFNGTIEEEDDLPF